jgi:hypothetical protein
VADVKVAVGVGQPHRDHRRSLRGQLLVAHASTSVAGCKKPDGCRVSY